MTRRLFAWLLRVPGACWFGPGLPTGTRVTRKGWRWDDAPRGLWSGWL